MKLSPVLLTIGTLPSFVNYLYIAQFC